VAGFDPPFRLAAGWWRDTFQFRAGVFLESFLAPFFGFLEPALLIVCRAGCMFQVIF
jgi:hypothetical protein